MRGTSDQHVESLVALIPEDLVPHEHPIRRSKQMADRKVQLTRHRIQAALLASPSTSVAC